MIAKLTTLSSNPVEGVSIIDIETSTNYIFNCINIKDLKVYGSADSQFSYVFNPSDDKSSVATFFVDDAIASIVSEADVIPYSSRIYFDVYEDDDLTSTPVSHSFLLDDVIIGVGLDATKSVVYLSTGAFGKDRYIVKHTLDEIVTLAKTGS